ncbi:MAG: hypothetical protein RLZZ455_296 [Candidatus Parcubacteria bacterium]
MEKGLTTIEAITKEREVGKNVIVTKKSFTILSLFASQFLTYLHGVLLIAAAFSFLIGHYLDGSFILSAIFLNGILGFIQEYRAERSIEKLSTYITLTVRVYRDGQETQLPSTDLVPGDVIILSEGDRIPADCVIITSHRLEIDESILTGESLPVLKDINDMVFLGTLITKGKGVAQVKAIGMQTKFGEIAQSLSTIKIEQTPLQKDLAKLGKTLSLIVVCIAGLLIPLGILQGKDIFEMLLTSISIAVAAIPQGLPSVITIALAIGTSRMAKRGAIVRSMPAVETLGAVQIILVDKTGTLTENSMRVRKYYLQEERFFTKLAQACVLGNTASVVQKSNGWDIIGDKTDGSLLAWAKDHHQSIEHVIKLGSVVDEHVFDSKTRMITTVWERDKNKHVFVRGAPESILNNCLLSEAQRADVFAIYEKYAKEGLRVIAFGTKTVKNHAEMTRDQLETDLQFIGIIGIYDPPRHEVKTTIHQAKLAGIKTIMVTGDNELTALAIAKEIGLIEKDEDVITGEELAKMDDATLAEVVRKTRVFARTEPQDKLRITTMLQKLGFVVGVTGDGVNDALALKKANVGVAMGKSGTDVAKEASDMIITDDNFATFVKAIEEGRTIYRNIVTAITYLLAGNLSELSLVFFGTLLGLPAPLLPTQILWINLVTDVLPAMALASDNKNPDVLKQSPRDPKEPILTQKRIVFIAIIGFGIAGILLSIFAYFLNTSGETAARTTTFNVLIASHMLLAFFVRRQSIFRLNKPLVLSVCAILLLQLCINIIPLFRTVFSL